MSALMGAAQGYAGRGWVPIALGLDGPGYPKRPLTKGWTNLTVQSWQGQPWDSAKGIGLLLGAPSGNLSAIDVDDVRLSDAIWALIVRRHQPCRMVRTARRRLHLYVQEQQPSRYRKVDAVFEGREVPVELRAVGSQVTAPPSPGYSLTGYEDALDADPIVAPCIANVWNDLAGYLGVTAAPEQMSKNGGYPDPWQDHVAEGGRNQTMYREAHALRKAGVAEEQAVRLLSLRFEHDYDKGNTSWAELEQTIHSAYRAGEVVESSVAWKL